LKQKRAPRVYVGMCADLLHHGHLNIIEEASKLGDVIVGVLTDQAIASYKRLPFLGYDQRASLIASIKGVMHVVPQDTLSYKSNLEKYKPDFVVHGDDWQTGRQASIRNEVIGILETWGGSLVEVPYTKDISSTQLREHLRGLGTTPEIRRGTLKKMILADQQIRVLEAHSGLTGLMIERFKCNNSEFDAMWLSSLTHSASKGKPDIQYIDITTIINTINEIFDVTTKPMIVDLDNGGELGHFKFSVKTLERTGVSAVIIEDKIGKKRNSLFSNTLDQTQDSAEDFAHKISEAKRVLVTKDFMIIARIESLILGKPIDDALMRAQHYIAAGADGIMIHSKNKEPKEIIEFCEKYRKLENKVPLVVVPTTYNTITENELREYGVDIVIYANHLIRSGYPAMQETMKKILVHGRSLEVDENCMPISEILRLIPSSPV
jgi:phosphoenolpyruvate phosphomutase / 2-hydroxyethylphosphonate cytidylyltransferase